VLSRDGGDPSGPVLAKMVEAVFVRESLVWHVHVGGQVIRTTAEHPFYEARKGWSDCHQLAVGDRLVCADGTWAIVEDLLDTGEWETVYNVRVADFRTYFVGYDEWGFSVWAHNEYGLDRVAQDLVSEPTSPPPSKAKERHGAANGPVTKLRGDSDFAGYMLDENVQQNIKIHSDIQEAVKKIKPDLIVGSERGGRLMGDILEAGSPEAVQDRLTIAKTESQTKEALAARMVEAVKAMPAKADGQQLKIVILETMMSGSAARKVIGAAEIAMKNPEFAAKVSEVNVILARETFGFGHALAKDSGLTLRADSPPGVKVLIEKTSFLLGEDVHSIAGDPVSGQPRGDTTPIKIFNRDGVVINELTPGENGLPATTRDLFIAIMTGKVKI
jgi:hypothetical protein